MELVPRCHSQSGGSQGTKGRERVGTAAAEERFLGWPGGQGGEGCVPSVTGGEEVVTAVTEDEQGTLPEAAELQGVGLQLYPGCLGFGIGQRDGSGGQRARGRGVGLGRDEEAGGEAG